MKRAPWENGEKPGRPLAPEHRLHRPPEQVSPWFNPSGVDIHAAPVSLTPRTAMISLLKSSFHCRINPRCGTTHSKSIFQAFLPGSVLQGLIHFFYRLPAVFTALRQPQGDPAFSAQLKGMNIGVLTVCLTKCREIKVHTQILTLSNVLGAQAAVNSTSTLE